MPLQLTMTNFKNYIKHFVIFYTILAKGIISNIMPIEKELN